MINYCELARLSLSHFLGRGRIVSVPERVGRRAGCFVSLHEANGDLRGCIGTIQPVREDLVQEIIENAVSAGTRDPRFPAVTIEELQDLVFEVSVLAQPEPVADESLLDPITYGVVVESGHRRGVLLPDLEGVDSVAQQVAIAKRKARIREHEPVNLMRFRVEKYHERSDG